jgi:hypothetical protein
MTEPTAPRPVPGSHRFAPVPPVPVADPPRGHSPVPGPAGSAAPAAQAPGADPRLAGLDELPVAEHVAVFEAEHARLQRDLGTIEPL